jgi:methionyl-tRNA formyltransferase
MNKIVFFGTPDFAVESLRKIMTTYDVVGVVTSPGDSAVKNFAQRKGLFIMQPTNLGDKGFISELQCLDADLFVVVAFKVLPKEVWSIPKLGTFNLHASLLPKYRGAAPIEWAIVKGEKITGVTTFMIGDGIDTGEILLQTKIRIGEEDNCKTIHDTLADFGGDLVMDTIDGLIHGSIKPRKQEGKITLAPKLTKEVRKINWNKPQEEVYNHIRGFYPKAWMDGDIKILRTKKTNIKAEKKPGTITARGYQLFISCLDYELEIIKLQAPGKRQLFSADFLHGNRKTFEI